MGIVRTRLCEKCREDKPKDGFQWMDLRTRREWWCEDCQPKKVADGPDEPTRLPVVKEPEK